jgi:hypothetical protein
MFRAAQRSSSGALTVFAASGLHTQVVTGCSEVKSTSVLFVGKLIFNNTTRFPYVFKLFEILCAISTQVFLGFPVSISKC